MNKIVCAVCGNEENEYGLKYCKECGAELLYINEDFYFSDLDSDSVKQSDQRNTYDQQCMMTTGAEFAGYEIESYLTLLTADEILMVGRSWDTLGQTNFNYRDISRNLDYKNIMSDLKEIRAQLKMELQEQTIQLGGNALIGVSYSVANMMNAGMLLTITGTAVKLRKEKSE